MMPDNTPQVKIVIGDARQMCEVADESAHFVITSPPYWQLKDYGVEGQIGYHDTYEEYIAGLNRVWQECYRVLHAGCRVCVNPGDQFARSVIYGRYKVIPIREEIIRFCESIGFDYMGAIIWQKQTTMNTTGGATVMGSFPFPRNGIVKIDYEFILLFKKLGKPPKVTKEQKEESRLAQEEWNTYFAGHSKQSDPRLQIPSCRWRLKIGQADDMTFPQKASIDELFSMIAKGKVRTLPQRLRYGDKNKTVKGLHKYDFAKVLDVILGFNPNGNAEYNPIDETPFPNGGQNLQFVLTEDNFEKNLEACIVHAIRTGAPQVKDCIGEAENVLNTLPIGYLGMADVVSWSDLQWPSTDEHLSNVTVWELKTGSLNERLVALTIPQLIKYLRSVETVFPSSVSLATPFHGVIVARRPQRGAIDMAVIQNVLPKHQPYRFSVVSYASDELGQLNLSVVCIQASN